MNRKVIAVVLGGILFFLTLSLGGAAYIHSLRASRVEAARPSVEITSGRSLLSKKDMDELFKDDMDPKTQALPASAAGQEISR